MKKLIHTLMFIGAPVITSAILLSVGCGSPDKLGQGGNNGTAGQVSVKLDANLSGNGASGGGGGSGSTGPVPTGDANCGTERSNTSREDADVLLVLDRSGSMNLSMAENCYCDEATRSANPAGNNPLCDDTTNCTTRWKSLTAGLNTTLSSTPAIRWGLKLYSTPGGSSCNVSPNTVEVQVGDGSASAIQSQITNASPANNTPTAAAIIAATNYLKGVADNSNRVILLATDGEPNCKGGSGSTTDVPGTEAAIKAAADAGFPVYVIGIGPSVGNLNNFAEQGGTGTYFPATSDKELSDALLAISKVVATCNFTLSAHPGADMNNVAVYLDKNLIQKDDANGWSFGTNQTSIVLNGSVCDKVMSGEASSVEVIFGCPGYNPPIVIP